MRITDLPLTILCDMAAEECAELTKACLKLSRVEFGINPTPVNKADAKAAIIEEFADVLVTMNAVFSKCFTEKEEFEAAAAELERLQAQKRRRWRRRLNNGKL